MSKIIRNDEEVNALKVLDRMLDEYTKYSEDDKRKNWKKVKFSKDVFEGRTKKLCSLDPFSDEYKEAVFNFYRLLHKYKYHTDDEGYSIENIDDFSKIGFPYYTKSASVVGDYLMAYGFIIRTMNLPAGAKILDIGSGPGALTRHLMQMGYELTCVDVNNQFIELIIRIADGLGVEVKTLCCDMSDIEVNEKFDAIIFMESFHHTLEHEKVLSVITQCLGKDGKIFFAAEPIVSDDDDIPYPWGPRLNFESVYSIRQFGWIEMGYQEEYFRELLLKYGFQCKRFRSNETWWGDVVECKRIPKLKRGDEYYFGSTGNGLPALGYGWANPEKDLTWTDSNEAFLSFVLDKATVLTVELRFRFVVLLGGCFREQLIRVFVNEKHQHDWRIVGGRMIEVEKSLSFEPDIHSNSIVVKFEIQSPISPKELGMSTDDRELGIAMKEMRIM